MASPSKAVRAAVTHVDNGRAVVLNERGNQRRAHTTELRLPARQRENRLVRLLERLRQQVLPCRLSNVPLKASPADSIKLCAAKRLATLPAFAPPMPSHDEERGLVVLPRFDLKNILIGRAHLSLIGQAEIFHFTTSFDCVYFMLRY